MKQKWLERKDTFYSRCFHVVFTKVHESRKSGVPPVRIVQPTHGETPVPLPASSRGRLDKILEQLQADLLAFLRVKLRGKHVIPPNRRGETFAVCRARRHDRCVNRLREEAVHEINVAAAGNAAQDRAIASRYLDLVPANVRDLQPRLRGKTHNLSLENPQARRAAIEFLALLEQRLVADADPEKPPA